MQENRNPYVGEGADGARRSAEIDRNELDTLPPLDPREDEIRASIAAWEAQAERLEREATATTLDPRTAGDPSSTITGHDTTPEAPRPTDDDARARTGFRGGKVPPETESAREILTSRAFVDLRAVDALLDDLRVEGKRRETVTNLRETVLDAVRRRADVRHEERTERLGNGEEPQSATDVRREAVGAADDADVLEAIGSAFLDGAKEARGVVGDLLLELPHRGGKPRASFKVADGNGFELAVTRSARTELSVAHDAIDDVLAAHAVAAAKGTDALALGKLPAVTFAAGVREGISLLRSVLASNPTYRSTALDSLATVLENDDDDDLAKRLRKAYGRVDKGEPTVKIERKPIESKGDAK